MKEKITTIFRGSALISILFIILGSFLFFYSDMTLKLIAYVIASFLIASGIIAMYTFFKNRETSTSSLNVVYAIATIAFGIIVVHNYKTIASILPITIGFVILIRSAMNIRYALELKDMNSDVWTGTMILAILSALVGFVLIINPFSALEFALKIIGIIIIIYSLSDLVSLYRINKSIKSITNIVKTDTKKKKKEKIKDAEFEEKEDE